MIEIVQQTTKTEDKLENKLPKNIRQIGNPEKDFRIYMEDYVYTYLHPAQINGMETGMLPRLLILLGEINHFSNRSCAFVSGALQVEDKEYPDMLPELNDRTWRQIHREMQQYFQNCEIVGWVLDIPGNTLEITVEMEEMHRRNFVSQYQFFFLMDSKEREEAFYTWKSGRLTRKEGYFIYYEKNPQMQEYMISRREALFGEQKKPEEVSDRAASNYRKMMMEKKENVSKQRTGILSYLTSILTILVLCTVSVILLGNLRRMEDMEQTISVMSTVIESTEKDNPTNQVAVETISGNILPIENEASSADLEEEKEMKETKKNANQTETDMQMGSDNNPETDKQMQTDNQSGSNKQTESDRELGNVKQTESQPESGKQTETGSQLQSGEQTETGSQPQSGEQTETSGQPENGKQSETGSQTGNGKQSETDSQQETNAQSSKSKKNKKPKKDASEETPSEADIYRAQGYYIVQEGDSLRQICYKIYKTYTMMDALCKANKIDNQDFIYSGQKIILP